MLKAPTTIGILLMMTAFLLIGGFIHDAEAILADHDCSFCHDLHGAAGLQSLLNQTTTEAVCMSCHAVSINTTTAAAVHNPNKRNSDHVDYITCRQCHDPHDNKGNENGGTNIKLIGITFDPTTGQRFPEAVIRVAKSSYGAYLPVTFETRADFNISGTGVGQRGVCEVCHDPNHNAGTACTDCHNLRGKRHDHDWGFMPRDPNN